MDPVSFIFSHTAVLLKQTAAIQRAQSCDNSVQSADRPEKSIVCMC